MDLSSLAGSAVSAYTGSGALGLGSQTGGSGVGGTPNSLSANTPVDVTSAGPRYYGAQISFPGLQMDSNPINPPLPGQTALGTDGLGALSWGLVGLVVVLFVILIRK